MVRFYAAGISSRRRQTKRAPRAWSVTYKSILDFSVDTILQTTPEEIEEYRDVFDIFDLDRSDFKELGVAMRSMGQNPTEQEIVEMIEEVDIDGNGQIEFHEFCVLMKRVTRDNDADIVRGAFAAFDPHCTGRVNSNLLRCSLRHMGMHFSKKEADELIRIADKDRDGHVDYDEFVRLFTVLPAGSNNDSRQSKLGSKPSEKITKLVGSRHATATTTPGVLLLGKEL